MKILHTSDWHLGKVIHEYSFLEEQKHFLEQLLLFLQQQHHDILLVAGDIFDRSIPPAEAVTLLDWFLLEFKQRLPQMSAIFISGNHDSAQRLGFASSLLGSQNIHFCCKPQNITTPLEFKQFQIWSIPFLHPGTLVSEGERTHQTELDAAIQSIRPLQKEGHTQILMAHLFTLGGQESDSERAFLGESGFVSPTSFEGFDYVALGHLHKPQKIAPHIHYSGSPLTYSFSEIGYDKGALSLEWNDTLNITKVNLPKLRSWVRLKESFETLYNASFASEYQNTCVEIQLTDDRIVPQAVAALKTHYPYLLNLKQNPAVTGTSTANSQTSSLKHKTSTDFFVEFVHHIHQETPKEALIECFQDVLKEAQNETP